jgi:hypothetical protein
LNGIEKEIDINNIDARNVELATLHLVYKTKDPIWEEIGIAAYKVYSQNSDEKVTVPEDIFKMFPLEH